MNKYERIEEIKIIKSIVALNKIVDKLEQRLATLEKSVGRIHSILVQVNAIKKINDE